MLIGKIASESGFSRDTIRYYQKLGLLHADKLDRGENNYTNYPPEILDRLVHIRQLKELGFTLSEITGLMESFQGETQPCADLPTQLDEKMALIESKITLLEHYKQRLATVREACDGKCKSTQNFPDCFSSSCS